MKQFKTILTIIILSSLLMSFNTNTDLNRENQPDPRKELAHYPKAKEGMVRYVIFLDEKSDESLYKVEIIPGKMMNVDCNRHTLMGSLEEKTLEGWGYTYYDFSSKGQAASTMMMCPDQTKVDKFIFGQTSIIRYNSKLPIVIYAPKGFEVKYRIWTAGEEDTSSEN